MRYKKLLLIVLISLLIPLLLSTTFFYRKKLVVEAEIIRPSSTNFIMNPGFDLGFKNWMIEVNRSFKSYISFNESTSGNASLYIEVLNDRSKNLNKWVFRIRQYVNCSLMDVNYFSFDVKIINFSNLGNPQAIGYIKAHIGLLIDDTLYDIRSGVIIYENKMVFVTFFPRRIDVEEGVIYNYTIKEFIRNRWITVSVNLSRMFDEYRNIRLKYILLYILTRGGYLKTYVDSLKLINYSTFYPKILLKIKNPNNFIQKISQIMIDNVTLDLEKINLNGDGYYSYREKAISIIGGGEIYLKIFLGYRMNIREMLIETLDGEKYVIKF